MGMDFIELALSVEEELFITVPGKCWQSIESIGDLVDFVCKKYPRARKQTGQDEQGYL